MTWTRSKISPENQMMSIISSALSEYFFYGRKIYNEKRKMFIDIIEEKEWQYLVTETTFPTWKDMKRRYYNCTIRNNIPWCDDADIESDDSDYETIEVPSQNLVLLYNPVCDCSLVDLTVCTTDSYYYVPEYVFTEWYIIYQGLFIVLFYIFFYYSFISFLMYLDKKSFLYICIYLIFVTQCRGDYGFFFIYMLVLKTSFKRLR